jgi:arylsulfatase A-like enzyme
VPDVVTLPQHFKQHGYQVVGMGKIFHGGLNDEKSWSVPWTSPKAQAYMLPENQQIVKRKQQAARERGLTGKPLSSASRGPAFESADVPDNSYHDGALAEMAIESLQGLAKQDKPFFLAVGFLKPHLPFISPKKYWALYRRDEIKLADNPAAPKDAPPMALTSWGEMRQYEGIPAKGPVSDEQARELIHGYRAAVSYTDANVGRVIDELKRLGLAENTIIILWGDHGWKLGEHGAWCKHTNFELDARSTLILSAPGAKSLGAKCDALVEFVDIYPTLAELAGLPLPDHLQGSSFAPLVDDPARKWKTAAFSQYPRAADGKRLMGYSLRTDRYRFTQWIQRDAPDTVVATELYDHQTDPAENVNVAGVPDNAKLVRELSEQLKRGWQGARPGAQK